VSRNARRHATELLFVGLSILLLPRLCGGQATDSLLLPDQRTNATRVLVVRDTQATELFQPRIERLRVMVMRGLTNLTGKATIAAAWQSLVSTQDVIGLKVYSGPGPTSGTRPTVVAAVVESLLQAKIPTNHIIVWDKRLVDLKNAGFDDLANRYGISVEACSVGGYDEKTFYDTPLLGHLVWGDRDFGNTTENVGRKSYVARLVTRKITKIVNISPLLNHHTAGVCGNLFSLSMGSVDNTLRFESDYNRLASAAPEIIALPVLGDRTVLNIVDALICQYQGEQTMLLHYSAILNELRFSKDPVALDVLSIQELDRQRKLAGMASRTNSMELFQNAALLELGTSEPQNIRVQVLQ
jgi:Domain of unknown function (DUF362)